MRKGFAITPVLFVGLALVTGLMLINFTDLDRRVSEGISKESQLNRLQSAFFENMTATETLLLFYSANESTYASTKSNLESRISARMGGPVSIPLCGDIGFVVEFNETFSMGTLEAFLNRTYSLQKVILCEHVNGLTGRNTTGSGVDCQDGN